MERRGVSLILMAVGVLCGALFTLLNLGGVIGTRLDKVALYAGIITIAAGLIVFATTNSAVKKEGRR